MKTNSFNEGVNSCEGLQGFPINYCIYNLVKKDIKKAQTLHNPSQTKEPKIQEIEKKDAQPSGNEERLTPLPGETSPYVQVESEAAELKPGDCEHCKAAGYWDWGQYAGQGLICGHRAYFLGKSGKPIPCHTARKDCPLKVKHD